MENKIKQNRSQRKKSLKLITNILIRTIDCATGKIKETEEIHNAIVNSGLERMARRIISNANDFFDYIGIGTGVTGVQATDTTLETEVTREQATVTYEANYKAKLEKIFTFSSGEAYDITEVGVLDDVTVSGSDLLNRATFTPKSVDSDTDLEIIVTITVADA